MAVSRVATQILVGRRARSHPRLSHENPCPNPFYRAHRVCSFHDHMERKGTSKTLVDLRP